MGAGDYLNERIADEREQAIDADSNKWIIPFSAGIGAIGLGAMLLRNRIATGNRLLSNLFNFLGAPRGVSLATDAAANAGKSAVRGSNSGLRSIFNASYDINKNRVNLGPIDLIDDLRTSVELIGINAKDKSIADKIKERTIEYVNREMVTGGNNTGYFTQGLQRVTAGQILSDQKAWSHALGNDQISVLSRARKLGIITDTTVVDKKLYYNAATNEALDFRLRNLFTKVTEINTPSGQSFGRTLRFDMFGQGDVIRSIPGLSNRGIGVLGPGDGYRGSRIFIGGNVYGYSKDPATGIYTEVLLGKNRVLRKAGDPFEVITASRQGRIDIKKSNRPGFFGGILNALEDSFGIGPGFGTRPTLLERLVINPYKRFKSIQNGTGVIVQHPYKRAGASKLVDAAMGADIPELSRLSGTFESTGPGAGVATDITRLGPLKRLAVLFGVSDTHSVVLTEQYRKLLQGVKSNLTSQDLVVPVKTGNYRLRGKTIFPGSPVNKMTDIISDDLTAVGYPTVTNRYAYYDSDKLLNSSFLAGLRDFVAYTLYRVNSLASESLLGIAMKPDHSILRNIARLGAIPVAYETAKQTVLYADYLAESTTGFSPIKGIASVYAGARLAQQKLREITGIQQAASFMETYFPGSIDSEGSLAIRSIVAPLGVATALLGKGKLSKVALGTAATYVAIGGPEPGQTAEDLYREYTGDKKVPYRKGALWGLGYTPFLGGRPDRYGPGWYAKLISNYRTKSIYGSESEYWSYHANVFGVPFPTPSNLFGLSNILNPYRLEEINYNDRPYIQTSSPLSKFPIIGPALAATIGEIMKPTVYRQPDSLPMLKSGLADKGLTPSMARMLGIPAYNATSFEAENPNSITNLVARQANIATEPLGVYKFAMEFFGVSTKPDIGTELATSDTISDPGRQLYDSSLGGLFGQTEFIRRFMLSDYSSQYRRAAAINPIKNNMPNWLPGTYSSNTRDQDYFIDFSMGDPYSKIIDGESRLPGAGYESINKLHSGQSGVYSDVDKFLILADVAPYSASYKKYEKLVSNMELTDEWSTKVSEAIEQRRQVIGVDDRYKRYEEDLIALNMSTLAKGVYAPIRKAYDFLTHDVLAEIPFLGSKLFPFRNPYEQYRKIHVEGAEYASWDNPYEGVLRPMAYDMALEDPFTAAGKGAALGFLVSGPMRWFTPFRMIVGAPGHSYSMNTVIGGATIGAGLSAARISAGYGQDMIPYHVQEENEAINYMDKIAYIKGRMIQGAGGSPMFAAKTMVGSKTTSNYRSALPTSNDRRYFDYFASQESEDIRSQITQGLPSYMGEGLNKVWNNSFNNTSQADQETISFLENNQIPDSSWLGWRPEVSAAAVKLRLVQHGINGISENIHRYGFFEGHEIDLKTRLQDLQGQDINFVQSPIHDSFDSFLTDHIKGIKKSAYRIDRMSTPYGSRRDVTLYKNRDQELIDSIRFR